METSTPSDLKEPDIMQEAVVRDVMMDKSRIKTMMAPVEVASLFFFGMSSHGKYLVGVNLLFDGGMVMTY